MDRKKATGCYLFLLWAFALLGVACDASSLDDNAAVPSDSLSIAAVKDDLREDWRHVRSIPLEQTDTEFIAQVRDISIGPDGSIIVADGSEQNVKVYTPLGRIAAVVGAQGDGPGEFRQLSDVAVSDDGTIIATDASARRITVFAGDYSRLKTISLREIAGPLASYPVGENCWVVLSTGVPVGVMADRPIPHVLTFLDSDGTVLGTGLDLADDLPPGVTDPAEFWIPMRHFWGEVHNDSLVVMSTMKPRIHVVDLSSACDTFTIASRDLEVRGYRPPRPPQDMSEFNSGSEVIQWLQDSADWIAQPIGTPNGLFVQLRDTTRLLSSRRVTALFVDVEGSITQYETAPPILGAAGDSLWVLEEPDVEAFQVGVYTARR